jgi:peptidoglycan/LPS O-acetylase OafA/YrhL
VIEHVRNLLFVDYGSLEKSGIASKAFYFMTGFGHEAVVIFFVISGFLVGGKAFELWQQGRFEFRRYLCDRISRLYAVLIVALILGAIIDFAGASLFHSTGIYDGSNSENIVVLPDNVSQRVNTTNFVGNLLMLQNVHVETFGSNGPLWSLAHEWWYYLLFPLALTVWRGSTAIRITSAILFAAICCLVTKYILVLFGVWLVGVIGRVINDRKLIHWTVGLVLFLGSLGLMRLEVVTIPYLNQFLLGIGFALLLNSVSQFKSNWPLSTQSKWLADFSYSVYLIHFPVILFSAAAYAAFQSTTGRSQISLTSVLIFVCITLIAFLVSYLVSLVTENKTKQVRDWLYRVARIG